MLTSPQKSYQTGSILKIERLGGKEMRREEEAMHMELLVFYQPDWFTSDNLVDSLKSVYRYIDVCERRMSWMVWTSCHILTETNKEVRLEWMPALMVPLKKLGSHSNYTLILRVDPLGDIVLSRAAVYHGEHHGEALSDQSICDFGGLIYRWQEAVTLLLHRHWEGNILGNLYQLI